MCGGEGGGGRGGGGGGTDQELENALLSYNSLNKNLRLQRYLCEKRVLFIFLHSLQNLH